MKIMATKADAHVRLAVRIKSSWITITYLHVDEVSDLFGRDVWREIDKRGIAYIEACLTEGE